MKNLKWTTIYLLIFLAILFNVERLDFGHENAINIDSFVYALAVISIVLIIIFPGFWRSSALIPFSLFMGVYLLCKTMLYSSSPIIGGIHTYISITEVSLYGIIICLASRLSGALKEFSEAIEDFAVKGVKGRVKSLKNGIEDAKTEMIRSRRHGRPLGLIIVEPDPTSVNVAKNHFIQDIQKAMMTHYVFTRMGRVISGLLRRTDLIMEQHERGRFIILCPETKASRFKTLTHRIQNSLDEQLNVSVSFGVSAFPDESYTFEELVKEAEKHLIPSYEHSKKSVISAGISPERPELVGMKK